MGSARVLWAAAGMLTLALVLGGCGPSAADGSAQTAPAPIEVVDDADATDALASVGPEADPALPLEDSSGRTPADAFDEHIVAVATGDPDAVWKTYGCSPPADFDAWAREWEDAAEVYRGARVLEERVTAEGLAYVRVVYRMTSGDDETIIEEPGEWWRIELVDGSWKVGWLPRQ